MAITPASSAGSATVSKTARQVGTGRASTDSPKNRSAASSLNAPGSPWKTTLGASVIAAPVQEHSEQHDEADEERDREGDHRRVGDALEFRQAGLQHDRHDDRGADQLAHDDQPDRRLPAHVADLVDRAIELGCVDLDDELAAIEDVQPPDDRLVDRGRATGQLLADPERATLDLLQDDVG